MEQKQLWMTVVIALVVAVIASLLINTSGVGLSPKLDAARIRAHSCDADGVCEADKVIVTGNTGRKIELGTDLEINDSLYKAYISTNARSISLVPNVEGIFGTTRVIIAAGILSIYHPDYPEKGTLMLSGDSILNYGPDEIVRIGPKVSSSSLVGSGTAYVCADSAGQLFRSQTPCV